MNMCRPRGPFTAILGFLCLLSSVLWLRAASFTNNARLEVRDDTAGLTLNTNGGANTLTVSFWFRLSIPSDYVLSDHMTLVMNRRDGSESQPYAYWFRLNYLNGNLEYLARDSAGVVHRQTMILHPYIDRWYHVAVVRNGNSVSGYVDGRPLPAEASAAANTRSSDGVAIGGVNGGSPRYLIGDIQEVAIYQTPLSASDIRNRMFVDQQTATGLTGYFKLGASTNSADWFRNWAPTPPQFTDPATPYPSANAIIIEETDQAGEQSAFDSRKNKGDNALTPLSGAFSWSQTALARPTPGIAFDFRFGYSSATPTEKPADEAEDPYDNRWLGPGWRHTFEARIIPVVTLNEIRLLTWEGGIETWFKTNNVYRTRHREYRGELQQMTDSDFEWTTPERVVYRFRDPGSGDVMAGRLMQIRDLNNNTVQLNWDAFEGRITNVVDTGGGVVSFRYDDTLRRLTNVSFGDWAVTFGYNNGLLVSKSLAGPEAYANVATIWRFAYNPTNTLLERITDPGSNAVISVVYDRFGRNIETTDALSRLTRTEYNVPAKRHVRHTDPGPFQWIETYDRKGRVTASQDPLTNITAYAYDDFGNRIAVTEPLGWKTQFGYDDRANLIARTNALGEITRRVIHPFFNKPVQDITPQPADANGWTTWTNFYAYDNRGNLTNHYDAFGSLVRYTYASNGLVLTATDANGNTSRMAYDTNGFLFATIDPAANTNSFALNDVGWKLVVTNALNQVTTFAYNLNGNVVRTVDPLFRTVTSIFDPNGNLLSTTDAKAQATTFAYDAANQKTQMVDRTGTNIWLFTYTPRGSVDRATDPLGNSVTNIYDAANRVIAVIDPLGNSVTNVYDANGNTTNVIDKLGRSWTKTFDPLGRVIAEADPRGNAKQTAYDIAGRVKTITTPNGYPSIHEYDGRGRLSKWVDAENYQWLYAYDGVGNITNITDALGGHYVMDYGNRNERVLERNQDGFEWRYRYDKLLRPDQQTDPNGTVRSINYDDAGRIDFVTFSTGRTDDYQYDENNNIVLLSRARPGEPPTSSHLGYDVMDRLVEYTDAFGKKIKYGRDALGRTATLTYPDGKTVTNRFDPLSRLTNQVDWAGRPMTYTYDKADRLIRRTYPNGVSQTNTFDTAGRITGLGYSSSNPQPSSINLALGYAYDRNGNKTNLTERGTLRWPIRTLTDEIARYTASGRLIERQIATNSQLQTSVSYTYDPSGNMTNATGGGQAWAFAYDEDNRVTRLIWNNGAMNDSLINNRYDALGRRISRKQDGVETRYVLDLAGSMERILCEMTGAGQITAWYVHGPDLCYKVDTANNLICYHADAQANIIALTGANGTNLAQYAYTPYGRLLVSSNVPHLASNPYLFVGSQGVMEELPGLYFMRARYYSADVAVFLSTDPVKKIGPQWQPTLYAYGGRNPLVYYDADGRELLTIALIAVTSYVVVEYGVPLAVEAGEWLRKVTTGDEVHNDVEFAKDVADTSLMIFDAAQALKNPNIVKGLSNAAKAVGGQGSNYAQAAARLYKGILEETGKQVLQKSIELGLDKLVATPNHGIGTNGGTNGGRSTIVDKTSKAGTYAEQQNVCSTTPVNAFNSTSTTTSGSLTSTSTNPNAFERATAAVKSVVTTVKQAASNAWSTVRSWFRGKKKK